MAILTYLALCLIWGSTWLVVRIGLADMPPFTALTVRLGPALLFLVGLAWYQRTSLRPLLKHSGRVLQVSLLIYPVSYSLVYWGEQYVTSGLSAVVFASMPFFVALFSWWLLPGERVSPRAWLGLGIGFAGMVAIYWEQLAIGSTVKILGMAGITISAVVAAFNTVVIRRDLQQVPPVALTICTVGMGALIVPMYALSFEDVQVHHFTSRALAAAAYLGVVGSGVAFVLYFQLLARLRALTISLITFITPIVALVLGVFFDPEVLGLRAGFGVVMVLAGVLLASVPSKKAVPD